MWFAYVLIKGILKRESGLLLTSVLMLQGGGHIDHHFVHVWRASIRPKKNMFGCPPHQNESRCGRADFFF